MAKEQNVGTNDCLHSLGSSYSHYKSLSLVNFIMIISAYEKITHLKKKFSFSNISHRDQN